MMQLHAKLQELGPGGRGSMFCELACDDLEALRGELGKKSPGRDDFIQDLYDKLPPRS